MVYELSKDCVGFPDPHYGEEDGLIAVGGALTVDWLLTAYSYGIFPWYGFKENEQIMWWCPMQRFVIFPNEIHISHSMQQILKKDNYRVSINEAFNEVIQGCSKTNNRAEKEGAWLGNDMIKSFTDLYKMHFAVSIEVWKKAEDNENQSEKLIGGLYGVNIGKNFFGESMFSLEPNASKIALIYLALFLKDSGGIIDCQFETPHLKSMGGRYISYDEYMEYLNDN